MIRYILFLVIIICAPVSFAFSAETNLPIDQFGRIPILHEGRVKPMDSFARLEILKFSKKETPTGLPPLVWLANALFDPVRAVEDRIFLIENPTTRHELGLEERQKPLYSYIELVPGLEKTAPKISGLMNVPPKDLGRSEKDLLNIHENALEFTYILRSFSSVLPLNIQVSPEWRQKAGLGTADPITFVALHKMNRDVETAVKAIIKKKGKDPERYNAAEQDLVTLGWQLKTIGDAGKNNILLRVIPTIDADGYASPWELINDGKGSPLSEQELKKWIRLSNAWQQQDAGEWERVLETIVQDNSKISLEVLYNQIAPFRVAIFIFALSLCFSVAYFVAPQIYLYRLSFIVFLLGILVQFVGLAIRVEVMARPPVGTLYESILFVGLIAPIVSLLVEYRLKNGTGILSGAISGVLLGILGFSLIGEGDNMKVLGAVLNTRFWLTTHVLCITIGYGWCLLTSVLAHLLLLQKAFGRSIVETQNSLIKTMTTHSLVSLFFTTLGTILGGIWADQSWGRFWGWDPKENGALLIVLWLIWLIHGKIAGQISQLFWICGMALLSVVVAIAWVGVNLLGVGLHSYGFIEGVFWGLGGFAAAEALLIGTMLYRIMQSEGGHFAR